MKKRKNRLITTILGSAMMSATAFAGGGSCGAGICGAGRCGGNIQKEKETVVKISDAKKAKVDNDDFEEATMNGNAGQKSQMRCGAGKCGNM